MRWFNLQWTVDRYGCFLRCWVCILLSCQTRQYFILEMRFWQGRLTPSSVTVEAGIVTLDIPEPSQQRLAVFTIRLYDTYNNITGLHDIALVQVIIQLEPGLHSKVNLLSFIFRQLRPLALLRSWISPITTKSILVTTTQTLPAGAPSK